MRCTLDSHLLDQTVTFHGHSCPGLAIGIRAAEYALSTFKDPEAVLVCVAETDMCGVDAIQFLTGCTLGKGNLIHRDYGKMAFSFYDRTSGNGCRLLLRPEARGDFQGELALLMAEISAGTASDAQRRRAAEIRQDMQDRFMDLPIDEMFAITPIQDKPPKPARILESMVCAECGESVMESRTRRLGGQTLCIPCFEGLEQKR